ncbi:MAG TPA: NAD(P)H-dependent oxidoreductase subunit E [Candidatus Moranbacteria bacterium]|nr:NAD(P)H-dependent oxidoreductase subunit E [Candidatus Moranbacteria bacterium]
MQTIQKILLEFEPKVENLLPALKKTSATFGYVSEEDAQKIAGYFSIPQSKVFETASFYDLVKTKKQPQILIQVCSSANCAVNNSFEIIREIENSFKIKAEEISCLGKCGEGPIMIVNGKIYEKVNLSKLRDILEEYL